MSPETVKFIPKFIEAVEAGHIKLSSKELPKCDHTICVECAFDRLCEYLAEATDQGTYAQRWNTSYQLFIQPYINHKKSSIANFKLKYPELFI